MTLVLCKVLKPYFWYNSHYRDSFNVFNLISVIINLVTCCSKLALIWLQCWTQKKMFWRLWVIKQLLVHVEFDRKKQNYASCCSVEPAWWCWTQRPRHGACVKCHHARSGSALVLSHGCVMVLSWIFGWTVPLNSYVSKVSNHVLFMFWCLFVFVVCMPGYCNASPRADDPSGSSTALRRAKSCSVKKALQANWRLLYSSWRLPSRQWGV